MILTSSRIKALTQLLLDIGSIFFASVFLAPILDKPNFFWIAGGLVLASSFWYLGLKLIRN